MTSNKKILDTINYDERRKHFHIDWSLNITSIIAVLALIVTLVKYGNTVVGYLKSIDSRTNIMWSHFDKSALTKDELVQLGLR